jgi:archaellum component FlaC
VNERFEQIDKRFEQVDKKFEKVDKRFEQVNDSIINLAFKIEALTKAQEVTIRDYIIERDRHYDAKFSNLRMFNIATISLVAGVILKMAGIINF